MYIDTKNNIGECADYKKDKLEKTSKKSSDSQPKVLEKYVNENFISESTYELIPDEMPSMDTNSIPEQPLDKNSELANIPSDKVLSNTSKNNGN